MPDKEAELKGTLYWEFGKALGSVYANDNPVRIGLATAVAMDFMSRVNEALATTKVV